MHTDCPSLDPDDESPIYETLATPTTGQIVLRPCRNLEDQVRVPARSPSRMWRIPEMLLMVLGCLSRRDQASMASVCQHFWKIATPLVWASLSNVGRPTYLLHLLPSGLKKSLEIETDCLEERLPLLTPYTDKGLWDRFSIYAPLVKVFDLELIHWRHNLVPTIQTLNLLNMVPIFPNLHTLHIIACHPQPVAGILRAILCPSIRVVRVELEAPLSFIDFDTTGPQILAATHQLELHVLEIQTYSEEEAILTAIAEAVAAQEHLKCLTINDVSSRFDRPFLAASRLPDLEYINFMDSFPYIYPLEYPPSESLVPTTRGFSSLRSARIDGCAATVQKTLACIASTELAALEVVVHAPAEDADEPLSNLSDIMTEVCRFEGLEIFQITFPASKVRWADLSPMLGCGRMQSFGVHGFGISEIVSDHELQLMARAWPKLEELSLDDFLRRADFEGKRPRVVDLLHADYQVHPPKVTLGGLQRLAIYAPQLRRLSVAVDARGCAMPKDSSITAGCLKDLALPYSHTESDSAIGVANFISHTWPNLSLPTREDYMPWIRSRYLTTWSRSWKGPSFDVRGEDGPWPAIWERVCQASEEE